VRPTLAAVPALLVLLLLAAPAAQTWGNGSSSNAEFRYYGVHDAIAHLALEKVEAHDAAAAAWLRHWFLPAPGGYAGPSYDVRNLRPVGQDNLLGYTDDPDSAFQDWCNHHYLVHPRPGSDEQCAPGEVALRMGWARTNLTLSYALGSPPCNPLEHLAAYHAGVLAHYVGDLGQWGHTDDTRRDHSHPPVDPSDRTYHGYYESQVWGSEGLRALLADQRNRPWQPDVVADVEGRVVALAVQVNKPDGVTVRYRDSNNALVDVGSRYAQMLDGYVAAYDANQRHHGMRGYTPALWAMSMENVALSVDVLADLWWTLHRDARAVIPDPGVALPGTCPA
jgi:hypothetical protein